MSWLFDRLTDLAVADHLTIVIDPDTGAGDPGRPEIDQMLQRARHLPDTNVWEGIRRPEGITAAEAASVRFVASDRAESSALFTTLGPRDLGVSVGGTTPAPGHGMAAVHVDSPLDLASLLDALITLRSYAQRAVA